MKPDEIIDIVEGTLGLSLNNVSRMTIEVLFEGQVIEVMRCLNEDNETTPWLMSSILSKIYDRGFYDGAEDHKQKLRTLLGVE